ncbi:protein NRT1/ PTR FAMILY 5.6-like isoform X2 [Cornus florida]|uniref:protein NRT1/ PTR FAMILY 5.6-like isoform X2 n=1 Tax=Cornus florida TaxID=4283 RepID=UPI00289B62F8|nr:protein NRT1/ PTR FAMILY 5.6-like isoform X2 [Cornus florida]
MPKLYEMSSSCLLNLGHGAIKWFHYYVVLSWAAIFISGLVFSHGFVEYALSNVLISYLTTDLKMEYLPKATTIIYIRDGVSSVLTIVLAHISDAYTGRFEMVAISTAFYILGLLLMRLFGTQIMLFFVAMALVAVGSAGHEPVLKAFLADQLSELEPKPSIDEERVEARASVWWRVARFSGATTATFAILSDTEWKVKFHASLIAMVIAYLLLWLGFSLYYCNWMGFSLEYCNWWAFSLYYCKKATGSPLTLVFRVLKAAIMKCHLDYPLESTQFYRNDSNQLPLFPRVRFLRLLDKAAIVEKSSLSPEEQEITRRVFTVAQVKEVKLLFRTAPMWIPFYVYSLVAATGNTFFIDQAANLNDKIGDGFVVPMNIFFLMRSFSSFTVPFLWDLLISKHLGEGGKHLATLVRIGCGMVCLILCCITAWQVELQRLHDSTGQMSILWLAPQYCLLGAMEGLALVGLQVFFYGQVAESMRSYGPPFTECVLGIGKFISIPFIFIFRHLKYEPFGSLLPYVSSPLCWEPIDLHLCSRNIFL